MSASAPSILPHSFCASNAVACTEMLKLKGDDYAAAARHAINGVHGAAARAPLAPGATPSVTAALATFWSGRVNLDPIVFERDCGDSCAKPAQLLRGRVAAHLDVPDIAGHVRRPASLANVSAFGAGINSVGTQLCEHMCTSAPTAAAFQSCHKTCTNATAAGGCVSGCMSACTASGRAPDVCQMQCKGLCVSHSVIDAATSSMPVPLSW